MISLKDVVVAILVENGFEQVELTWPRQALDQDGATTIVVSPRHKFVRAWNSTDWGDRLPDDHSLDEAQVGSFDALLLLGGVTNPDTLRLQPKAVRLVRGFFDAGKPVASICHGPWAFIGADVVRQPELSSWPSLKTDLRNAGSDWSDREVVTDGRQSRYEPQACRHPGFQHRDGRALPAGRQTPEREAAVSGI